MSAPDPVGDLIRAARALAGVAHYQAAGAELLVPEAELDALRDALAAIGEAVVDGSRPWNLPYEEVPDGPLQRFAAAGIADHLTAGAGVLVEVPEVGAVELTFQAGRTTGPPLDVAAVTYLGTADALRKAGKLLRDTFYAAARKAEAHR